MIYPRMAEMLASGNEGAHNMLSLSSADLSFTAAPAFSSSNTGKDDDESRPSKILKSEKKGKYKLTVDQVNKLFRDKGWGNAKNLCLKRAVLCGHFEVTKDITKDYVVLSGQCLCCDEPLSCTINDALNQPWLLCWNGL